MPKGRKRTKADYEKEIVETASRMRKHPEYLRSARNNSAWTNFLENVLDIQITSDKRANFFEDVRKEIRGTRKEIKLTDYQKYVTGAGFKRPVLRNLQEANAESVRDKEGVQLRYKSTGLPKYRNKETGRFISIKTIVEGI